MSAEWFQREDPEIKAEAHRMAVIMDGHIKKALDSKSVAQITQELTNIMMEQLKEIREKSNINTNPKQIK